VAWLALGLADRETRDHIAWHQRGIHLYWAWKSRVHDGRPAVPKEVRDLIRHMSLANPGWGAPRIHGELLKLGIEVSESTVARFCRFLCGSNR
jgi:hypothetical protein